MPPQRIGADDDGDKWGDGQQCGNRPEDSRANGNGHVRGHYQAPSPLWSSANAILSANIRLPQRIQMAAPTSDQAQVAEAPAPSVPEPSGSQFLAEAKAELRKLGQTQAPAESDAQDSATEPPA